jgi:hypothetical protein
VSGESGILPPKYDREETLEAQFTAPLGRLRFDDEMPEWMRGSVLQRRHHTFRKCRNVRLESGIRTKAGVRRPL